MERSFLFNVGPSIAELAALSRRDNDIDHFKAWNICLKKRSVFKLKLIPDTEY
jgi:hypothetical protein